MKTKCHPTKCWFAQVNLLKIELKCLQDKDLRDETIKEALDKRECEMVPLTA